MKVKQAIQALDVTDRSTLIACLHYCATLNKKQRAEFVKEYGTRVDENITKIMQKLLDK
ncbi:MAG: hypothetical protein RBR68_13735 [Tenuifilaceae bacterium]|jgi:hypothetical protein|nr:hypothetical protein [Tenuifilaceae bacterium]